MAQQSSDNDDDDEYNIAGKYFINESKPLGSGNFGSVFEGVSSEGKEVAIKVFPPGYVPSREIQNCELLMKKNPPGVVKYYGAYKDGSRTKLVMERLMGKDVLQRIPKNGFSELIASRFMYQLFTTINYLHVNLNMVHCDLKHANIVYVNPDSDEFRLIDFGLSLTSSNAALGVKTKYHMGTKHYMAPEVVESCIYSSKSDMFAIGVIFYSLLSGKFPFFPEEKDYLHNLLNGIYSPINTVEVSDDAKDLISKLLHRDRAARISAAEALQHPWFANCNRSDGSGVIGRNSSEGKDCKSNSSDSNKMFDSNYLKNIQRFISKETFRRGVNKVMHTNFIIKHLSTKAMNGETDKSLTRGQRDVLHEKSANGVDHSCNTNSIDSNNHDRNSNNINNTNNSISNSSNSSSSTFNSAHDGSLFQDSSFLSTLSSEGSVKRRKVSFDPAVISIDDSSSPHSHETFLNIISVSDNTELDDKNCNGDSNHPRHLSITQRKMTQQEIFALRDKFVHKFSQMGSDSNYSDADSDSLSPRNHPSDNDSKSVKLQRVGSTETLTGLDFNSFCEVLYSLDLHVFAKQHIFNLFGSRDDGLIDYRDFLSYLISLQSFDDDSIRLYFQLFDANGDDKLTIEEFQLVLGSMLQNNPPMGTSDKSNSRDQEDLQQTNLDADDAYNICRHSSSEIVRNSTDHITELFQSKLFEGGEIGFEDFKNWMKTRFVYIKNAFIPPTFILDNDKI